jgi:hypothetical protein
VAAVALEIPTASVFEPLLYPSRYKGAYGGRGSAKSHFFAGLIVDECVAKPGTRAVCVREVQKSLKESAMRLIADKIESYKAPGFKVKTDQIDTPGGGVILFQGLQDHTNESIKSLEGFRIAWIEEAQTLSARSLEMLRPTIRAPGSEIWASWNPRNAADPVDAFFRGLTPPPDCIAVRANYSDNPWFPSELEMERAHDEATNPVRYAHIWLGEYEPAAIGAIWDRLVLHNGRRTRESCPTFKRIVVAVDPNTSNEPGADEAGVVVVALGEDGRGYFLEDGSLKGGPEKWAKRTFELFDKWQADCIIAEVNQGGDMVRMTLSTVRPAFPYTTVHASRGKHVRAEPIAALYHGGQISHVGTFQSLEDQMCLMTASGYDGDGSPDRCDAMVWAFTDLFDDISKPRPTTRKIIEPMSYGGWMS